VEVVAVNVPALAGAPLYDSLKLRLMGALGGLNAAQGVEIGAGSMRSRGAAASTTTHPRDRLPEQPPRRLLGGITTGMPLVCRVAFKPTASSRRRSFHPPEP
jgi:chorismate synthase